MLTASRLLSHLRCRRLAAVSLYLLIPVSVCAQDLYVADSPTLNTPANIQYVHQYDAKTGAFVRTLGEDAPYHRPLGLAFGPEGGLYVSQANAPYGIQRFDLSSGHYQDTFMQGSAQALSGVETMAFRNGMLYACLFGGQESWEQKGTVKRFDAVSGAYIDTLVQPGSGGLANAGGMVFGPDGTLYVGNVNSYGPGPILRYNGVTGEFLGTMPGNTAGYTFMMEFGPDGDLYAGTSKGVQRFSGTTHSYLGKFGTGGPSGADLGLAWGPDGDLYASREGVGVVVIDGKSGVYKKTLIPVDSFRLRRPFHLLFGPPVAVPEPGSAALILVALGPCAAYVRRRKTITQPAD